MLKPALHRDEFINRKGFVKISLQATNGMFTSVSIIESTTTEVTMNKVHRLFHTHHPGLVVVVEVASIIVDSVPGGGGGLKLCYWETTILYQNYDDTSSQDCTYAP
jgi:hypothetical protein